MPVPGIQSNVQRLGDRFYEKVKNVKADVAAVLVMT